MIYILLSILLISFNNVLWKRNLENTTISFLVAYRALFTSLVSFGLLLYFYGLTVFNDVPIFKITLGSIFGVIGLFNMLTVVKKASLQWLGIYSLLGIVFTSTYFWLFEELNLKKSVLGLLLIVIGFVFYIFSNRENNIKISLKQHALLAIMTFSFSLSSLIHWKNLTTNIPTLLILSNQEFVVFFTASIFTLFKRKSIEIKKQIKNYFFRVIAMGLIIFLALLCNFLGLKITNPIVSSVLFLASPLTTILFSALFFKEKLTLKNSFAILIIAFGAYILHYFSA